MSPHLDRHHRRPPSRPRRVRWAGALALAGLFALGASGVPDAQLNPVSGRIETVDTAPAPPDGRLTVRHIDDPGPGAPQAVTWLGGTGADERDPRLTIDPDGTTWVVYWTDGGGLSGVYSRHRPFGGAWSELEPIGEDSESGVAPEIAVVRSEVWISYEVPAPGGRGVAVTGKSTVSPFPFPKRTILHWSASEADLDVRLHTSRDQLWVSWIEDPERVGWSEYDFELAEWSPAQFESTADGGVDGARKMIEKKILSE